MSDNINAVRDEYLSVGVDRTNSRTNHQSDSDVLFDLGALASGSTCAHGLLPADAPVQLALSENVRSVLALVLLDDCAAFSLSLAGRAGLPQPVTKGFVLLLDPRERHFLRASESIRLVCFGMPFKALDQLTRRSEATRMISPATLLDDGETSFQDDTIHGLALSVEPVLRVPGQSMALFLEQIANAVAAHLLLRRCEQASPPAWRGGLAPWQLAKAKSLVLANLGTTLQANKLAEACGLSSSHFSRAFRRSTGTSPHAWLVDRRIAHAKHLMRSSNAKLADIALECGFADQSHLTRMFTREEGISPGSWRRYAGPTPPAANEMATDTAGQDIRHYAIG